MKKIKKRKESFWQKHYSLSWLYIKESRNYVLFIILIFLVGFLISLNYKPPEFIELIKKFVERILEETEGLNTWQMIIYILDNNLKNSFISLIFGIFFGIFPFFTALINGYVLGFVVEKSVAVEGISVLWKLFPHGIFEFPAVVLALALGIKLCLYQFSVKEKWKAFLAFIISLGIFLFLFIFIFGLPAATIFRLFLSTDDKNTLSSGIYSNTTLQFVLLISAFVSYIFSNYIGNLLFAGKARSELKKEFLRRFEQSLRVFLFVILPLLVIASIVEGILIGVLG